MEGELELWKWKIQIDHITQNLHDLVTCTDVNPATVSIFEENGILGAPDVSKLESIIDEQKKSKEFYKRIKTRPGFYEVLLYAMEETCQTGVVKLLKMLIFDESKAVGATSHKIGSYSGGSTSLQQFPEGDEFQARYSTERVELTQYSTLGKELESNRVISEIQISENRELMLESVKQIEQPKVRLELVELQSQVPIQKRELESSITNVRQNSEIRRLKQELEKKDRVIIKLKKEIDSLGAAGDAREREFVKFKKLYYRNRNGDSELHMAVDRKNEQSVRDLVEMGADFDVRNKQFEAPLHRASVGTNKEISLRMIKYLIENGADVKAKDIEGLTFLHKIVGNGTVLTPSQFHDMVAFLVSKNLSHLFVISGGDEDATPLNMAVENLEIDMETMSLLKENRVSFNVGDYHDNAVLYCALKGGKDGEFISKLIDRGANGKHINNYNQSLLHSAAEYCSIDGLNILLNLGLDVNSIDVFKQTPLHWAVQRNDKNQYEMIKILIERGATVNVMDKDGKTPLDWALELKPYFLEKDKVVQLLRDSL